MTAVLHQPFLRRPTQHISQECWTNGPGRKENTNRRETPRTFRDERVRKCVLTRVRVPIL